MIVPQFWAEARLQQRKDGRQITVRRFGWSDTSQAAAQTNADARVKEAFERALAGEKLARSEPKIAYNGAAGVPIREEVISRHGDTVITRNSYGALCLNTPTVMFADIDFPVAPPLRTGFMVFALLAIFAIAIGWAMHSMLVGIALSILAIAVSAPSARLWHRKAQEAKGGAEQLAKDRIARFAQANPSWNLRVYKTPAGLRLLATHQPFDPGEPAVDAFFKAVGTDSVYAKMCVNQQCFRARVSPKPWRIGISRHMKPRPGVWPVRPERLPDRNAWIAAYDAKATNFASCKFIESIGSGIVHVTVVPVQELHDELCRANAAEMPIA
jgi:hypothetical protein